jgi:mono/diheme cytochrome c family protein
MGKFVAGILFTLVVGAIIALCVVKFGLVNMRADAAIPRWEQEMAESAAEAYMDKHAPKVTNPVQLSDQNLTEGVRLYKTHCAVCHGGPANPISQIGRSFYPHVPQFLRHAPDMPDHQNFFITKYGVRWTGMPGWETVLSDDQIWRIIGFLSKMDKIDQLPAPVQEEWKRVDSSMPAPQMNQGANTGKVPPQGGGAPDEDHEHKH